jgi:hypothetical protein
MRRALAGDDLGPAAITVVLQYVVVRRWASISVVASTDSLLLSSVEGDGAVVLGTRRAIWPRGTRVIPGPLACGRAGVSSR